MTYFVKLTAPSTTTMSGRRQEEYGLILNVANIRSVVECKPGDDREHGFPESGCVLHMDTGDIHPVKEGLAEVWEALVGPEEEEAPGAGGLLDIETMNAFIQQQQQQQRQDNG